MERYIAVDNVCAWPNLTRMPDGAIIATIFNQPTHGGWEGDVDCWASEDGGRMWSLRGTAAPHEPTTNRMNVAAGLARDGSLVVIASGWSNRNGIGEYSSPSQEGKVLPSWVCRSSDGGRTWSHSDAIKPPTGVDHIVPFGDVIQCADGTLGVSVYGWNPPEGSCSLFYTSDDDGLTWTHRGTIAASDSNETAPLALSDGKLLAAVRTAGDGHLELYGSSDHGMNWNGMGTLSLPAQIPAHLCLLNDGKVLLAYGMRNKGYRGINVRVSEDGGQNWGAPCFLIDLEDAGDLGYPASVQNDDGTIVTAWYCGGVPAHRRYHVGVARWTIEELTLTNWRTW
jgi:hypothetical protein